MSSLFQEIQSNAFLRIGCIRRGHGVKRLVKVAKGVAKQEIRSPLVLEGIAKVGPLNPVPGYSLAERWQVQLFVQSPMSCSSLTVEPDT
jgi:hypothetical protein